MTKPPDTNDAMQIIATLCALFGFFASAAAAWISLTTRVAIQSLEIRVLEKLEGYVQKEDLVQLTARHRQEESSRHVLSMQHHASKPDWWSGFLTGMKEKQDKATARPRYEETNDAA